MKKKETEDLRLNPQARLCPAFDEVSVKLFAAPDREEMGVYVVDNCAEEHIMQVPAGTCIVFCHKNSHSPLTFSVHTVIIFIESSKEVIA